VRRWLARRKWISAGGRRRCTRYTAPPSTAAVSARSRSPRFNHPLLHAIDRRRSGTRVSRGDNGLGRAEPVMTAHQRHMPAAIAARHSDRSWRRRPWGGRLWSRSPPRRTVIAYAIGGSGADGLVTLRLVPVTANSGSHRILGLHLPTHRGSPARWNWYHRRTARRPGYAIAAINRVTVFWGIAAAPDACRPRPVLANPQTAEPADPPEQGSLPARPAASRQRHRLHPPRHTPCQRPGPSPVVKRAGRSSRRGAGSGPGPAAAGMGRRCARSPRSSSPRRQAPSARSPRNPHETRAKKWGGELLEASPMTRWRRGGCPLAARRGPMTAMRGSGAFECCLLFVFRTIQHRIAAAGG